MLDDGKLREKTENILRDWKKFENSWNNIYQKWKTDRSRNFTEAEHNKIIFPSYLNDQMIDYKKLNEEDIISSLEKIDSMIASAIFKNSKGKKLRENLVAHVQPLIPEGIIPMFSYGKITSEQLRVYAEIIERYYDSKTKRPEKRELEKFLSNVYFFFYDQQLSSQHVRYVKLVKRKNRIAKNQTFKVFKNVDMAKVEDNINLFINDSLKLIYNVKNISEFEEKNDLYEFPYNDSDVNKGLKKLLKKMVERISKNISKLSIEKLNKLEISLKKGGLNRIIFLKGDKYKLISSAMDAIEMFKGGNFIDKDLFKKIISSQTNGEVKKHLDDNITDSNMEIVFHHLLHKAFSEIKKDYVNNKKSGRYVDLRVLTLNTFLLYAEPMASDDVYSRAAKIAEEISRLDPMPDIILFQEIFPNDINSIKDNKILWPNIKDWPLRDMSIIQQKLNSTKKKYFDALLEHKQIGRRYQTLGDGVYRRYKGESREEVYKDNWRDGLNLGPTGLSILVSKNVIERKIKKGLFGFKKKTKKKKITTSFLGSFFSRYDRGTVYNKFYPVSRGSLTTLFDIEGLGIIDITTTHLATGTGNNLHRVTQLSQLLHERKMMRNEPENYGKILLAKFLISLCSMHSQELACSSESEIDKLDITHLLSYFKSLQSKLKGILSPVEFNNIHRYFSSIFDNGFQKRHILSIVGGDMNFQPFGDRQYDLDQRTYDKWPYQIFKNDPLNIFSFETSDDFLFYSTYDPKDNILAKENLTNMNGQILEQMQKQISKFREDIKLKVNFFYEKYIMPASSLIGTAESSEGIKLDYLMMRPNIKNDAVLKTQLSLVEKSKIVFKNKNEVSDHFGILTDIKIFKEQ